jgi:uncharacterized membrane protein YoaK (UPF0700 family)
MIVRVAMAVGLSFLAGFVDALGFLHLGSYFVTFMSGNSTLIAVALPDGLAGALMPIAIICLFVIGVMVGSLMEQRFSSSRALIVLAAMLGIASGLGAIGFDDVAVLATPLVMGAMNMVMRTGHGGMAVTYMTGNLVKLGQAIVASFQGAASRWAWLPFLLLWVGLIAGAVCGAIMYQEIGLAALWMPTIGLIGLAFIRLSPT